MMFVFLFVVFFVGFMVFSLTCSFEPSSWLIELSSWTCFFFFLK